MAGWLSVSCIFLLILVVVKQYSSVELPPNVRVVASGFTWAENLAFNGAGSLFVTDTMRGQLFEITPAAKVGTYDMALLLEGFDHLLGVVVDEAVPWVLYSVGRYNNTDVVISVPVKTPSEWRTIVTLPKIGNGLRRYANTGLLYTASEGNFLPGDGEVFEVNVTAGTFRSLKAGLWAADGLWIDEETDMLYVGELFNGSMWAYDLYNDIEVGYFSTLPTFDLLDDFCLSKDGSYFIGANFLKGSIDAFPANNTGKGHSTPLVSGLQTPTSVRWGSGPGFNPSSLFITEGGGVISLQKNRRVLEYYQ